MDTETRPRHESRPQELMDVKVKGGMGQGPQSPLLSSTKPTTITGTSRAHDLHNDIFEVVVDGDLSGGPLIDIYHRDVWTPDAVGKARSVIDLAH